MEDVLYTTINFECEAEFFRCECRETIGLTITTHDGRCVDIFFDRATLLAALANNS